MTKDPDESGSNGFGAPTDDPDIGVFPDPLDSDEHDPLGIEVATQIARNIAGILPPPRGVSVRKPRRRPELNEQRSGSGPDDRDPQLLKSSLDRLVTRRGWKTQLGLRRLLESWPQIVGSVNAQHSQPVGFDNKVLSVRAESTTWATVLRQMAPQLVAKLNAELGEGAVIRIDIRGPAAPSWSHGPRSVRDGRGPRDTYG